MPCRQTLAAHVFPKFKTSFFSWHCVFAVNLIWQKHFGIALALVMNDWHKDVFGGHKAQALVHLASGKLLAWLPFLDVPNFRQNIVHLLMHLDFGNAYDTIGLVQHHITFAALGVFHTCTQTAIGFCNGFTQQFDQGLQSSFAGWPAGNQIHTILENIWLVQLANLLGENLLQ